MGSQFTQKTSPKTRTLHTTTVICKKINDKNTIFRHMDRRTPQNITGLRSLYVAKSLAYPQIKIEILITFRYALGRYENNLAEYIVLYVRRLSWSLMHK
jgi:hypothetical protein